MSYTPKPRFGGTAALTAALFHEATTKPHIKCVLVSSDLSNPENAAMAFIMLIGDMHNIEFLEMPGGWLNEGLSLVENFTMLVTPSQKDRPDRSASKDRESINNYMNRVVNPSILQNKFVPFKDRGVIPGIYKPKHKSRAGRK